MKIRFLNVMFTILALIGIILIGLSVWFSFSMGTSDISDISFRINLLTFLTGILYLLFIYIIAKIVKNK